MIVTSGKTLMTVVCFSSNKEVFEYNYTVRSLSSIFFPFVRGEVLHSLIGYSIFHHHLSLVFFCSLPIAPPLPSSHLS